MAELLIIDNSEKTEVDDFEEKRESLIILATLGEKLTSEKNYQLNRKGINKFYREKGKKVAQVIRERGIKLCVKMISYFLPIYSPDELSKELEDDELVNRELSNMIGLLVMKGGRFVALTSGLIQVANHIVEPTKLMIKEPEVIYDDIDKML